MEPVAIIRPVAIRRTTGENGLAADLRLDVPCPTVGAIVVGITMADAPWRSEST
jgi:hypothetical protein